MGLSLPVVLVDSVMEALGWLRAAIAMDEAATLDCSGSADNPQQLRGLGKGRRWSTGTHPLQNDGWSHLSSPELYGQVQHNTASSKRVRSCATATCS